MASQPQVSLKRRGKRVVGLTVLQSRSEVEKERIVGDKVARGVKDEMGEEPPDNVMRKQKRKALTTGAWQPSWTW